MLYNFLIYCYGIAIRLYGLFNPKAARWIAGRRGWKEELKEKLPAGERRIWIHCASLGEFEQARPLIEALKSDFSQFKIVLSFFSPSGYETCRDFKQADHIFYLPLDSRKNARIFLSLVAPRLSVFVKYEFWFHYLHQLYVTRRPAILISSAFREDQIFFKPYGGLFRQMLGFLSLIFVQDNSSKNLLESLNLQVPSVLAGDTRYDRVAAIAAQTGSILQIEAFQADCRLLIAGSTWPQDETLLWETLSVLPDHWKMVVAPHEVTQGRLTQIKRMFGDICVCFSEWEKEPQKNIKRILVLDNVGMLSRAYQYGSLAYVGGGFQKGGIHNILEPAVFGLPVVFGPVYKKFVEAVTLVSKNLAFPVKNRLEAERIFRMLTEQDEFRRQKMLEIKDFVQQNLGATSQIVKEISKHGWLSS